MMQAELGYLHHYMSRVDVGGGKLQSLVSYFAILSGLSFVNVDANWFKAAMLVISSRGCTPSVDK